VCKFFKSYLTYVYYSIYKYYDLQNFTGKDSFHIVVSLARPQAKGLITLSGSSYKDEPLIDAKYLDNPHDIGTLVEGDNNNLL